MNWISSTSNLLIIVFFSIITCFIRVISLCLRFLVVIMLGVLLRIDPGILRLGSCFCGLWRECRCLSSLSRGLSKEGNHAIASNIILHTTTYHFYQAPQTTIYL